MSTPLLDRLSAQFTQLIGPEAFAKAAAAAEAAKAAAAEAAKIAAAKAAAAAAAAAAAKAATPAPAAPKPAATPASPPSSGTGLPTRDSVIAAGGAPTAAIGGALAAPRCATPSTSSGQASAQPTSAAPATVAPTTAKPATPAAVAPKPATPTPVVPAAARPAPAPAAPSLPPIPPPPLQTTDFAQKGYHLDATIAPQQVPEAARLLDTQGFSLDAITGVDWLAQNEMEVVYDFFHPLEATRVVVRTRVARATPELPTIVDIFPGANWHERETHDFFGIRFAGHPNLKPFLLPEDANFHPLRKDYAP